MRHARFTTCLIIALALPFAAVLADSPSQNVDAKRQPNLAAAQKLAAEAYVKLEAAVAAKEFDMDGHAQKAKDLLVQVNAEIKLAAKAANKILK